ncbi:MAG: hypothetical protein ACREDF_11120 [Thermoplasmata archaeon]
MFESTKGKAAEAERLSDTFKRKISELQLLILSGQLSQEGLARAEAALRVLQQRIKGKLSEHETERLGPRPKQSGNQT